MYLFHSGFPSFEKFWPCLCPLSIDFLQTQRTIPLFIARLFMNLLLIGTVFVHLRDFLWEDTFELDSAAAARVFVRVQDEIDVCTSHCKPRIKLHSSSWFSVACVTFRAHRYCIFNLLTRLSISTNPHSIRIIVGREYPPSIFIQPLSSHPKVWFHQLPTKTNYSCKNFRNP